jgi:ABC-type glutathione transport system ATPase component
MTTPDAARLEISDLRVTLGSGRHRAEILKGVSLSLAPGETLGVVGESGSGKSTLAKTIVGIHRLDSGAIRFDGVDIAHPDRALRSRLHRDIQLIPQDPYSSLDPRRTVGQTIAEAIDPRRPGVRKHVVRIGELLDLVGLAAPYAERYPHELSGGQRQRVAIARALAVAPLLIIADEITSALDVSTQAQIIELLGTLKKVLGITLIFVSHDLAVVQQLSDAVLVLLQGEAVEQGPVDRVFLSPRAEYTRTLIDSVPGAR